MRVNTTIPVPNPPTHPLLKIGNPVALSNLRPHPDLYREFFSPSPLEHKEQKSPQEIRDSNLKKTLNKPRYYRNGNITFINKH